jgi:hypothetical protein
MFTSFMQDHITHPPGVLPNDSLDMRAAKDRLRFAKQFLTLTRFLFCDD